MKRKIVADECVLLLWQTELMGNGEVEHDAQLHLFRQTVNGRLIGACDMAQAIYDTGAGYYTFPFLRFMAENGPICPTCRVAMYTTGLLAKNQPYEPFPDDDREDIAHVLG